MRKLTSRMEFARLPRDYAGLCQVLTPRPIHDRMEFQNVVEITDAMAGHDMTPDQLDYFDLLCRLIEDYEKDQIKPPKASALESLNHLLGARKMNAADLARLLGVHRTLGGMILRGERKLTLNHVRTLSRYFGISADIFVG